MKQWHIPRIKALVEAGVDLLALETIPCKVEAVMLIELLKTDFPQTKAWLTFSVRVVSGYFCIANLITCHFFSKMVNP